MVKYFINNFPTINIYKKPNLKSELVTQMIYGNSFSINKKTKKWLRIKIKEDNYKGFIQKKIFSKYVSPTHKIHVLKAKIFKFPGKKKVSELPFGSKVRVLEITSKYYRISEGWINKTDLKLISFKNKDPFKKIFIFKGVKYKWGGKSFRGIDCSGLIQVFLNFNNKYCPRDAKDQINFFKRNIKLSDIKKNDIIFWKGHVALAISKTHLIHAYGPMKKTVVMEIDKTIKKIEETANLKVLSIKRLKK